MSAIRIKTAAVLLGVSDDTIRRWVAQGKIEATEDRGHRAVKGESLAEFANQRAQETDLDSVADAGGHSVRNHLPGLVTGIVSDKVMSQINVQCGPFRVVSLISTEAVKDLGLQVGSVVNAEVKATNVSISLTSRS